MTIVLEPAASIRGAVVDESSRPLAGWKVHLLDGQIVDDAPVPPVLAEDLLRGGVKACVSTDERGNFELTGLAARPYKILVCDPVTLVASVSNVIGGSDSALLQVKQRDAPPFDGLLVSPDGTPVPGAVITPAIVPWSSKSAIPLESGPWTKTDEHGRFRIPALSRGNDVCVVCGDPRIVPQAIPVRTLSSSAPARIECRRFLRFRLQDWPVDLSGGKDLLIHAEDQDGDTITLYLFEESGWVVAPALPVSMAKRANLGVAESARRFVVVEQGSDGAVGIIPIREGWTEDVRELDLRQYRRPTGKR